MTKLFAPLFLGVSLLFLSPLSPVHAEGSQLTQAHAEILPFDCDGSPQEVRSYVPSDIKIKWVRVWIGVSYGTIADIPYKVVVTNPHNIILATNWDHYEDPTNFHYDEINLGDNYFLARAGSEIVLLVECHQFDVPGYTPPFDEAKAHLEVYVYYTQ